MEKITSQLQALTKDLLKFGVSYKDIYDLTLDEAEMLLEACREKHLEELKEQAQFDYQQAQLIGVIVSKMFDKDNKVKVPSLYDTYPALFEEEQKEYKRINQEQELSRWKAFVDKHNRGLKDGR